MANNAEFRFHHQNQQHGVSKPLRHDLVYRGIIERLFLKNSSVLHCSSVNWKKRALDRVATVRWRTLRNISYQRQIFPVSHSQSQFNKWKQSHDQEELQKLNNFVTKGRGTAQHTQFDSSCTLRILIPAHHSHHLRAPSDPFSSHTIQGDHIHSRGCLRSPTLEPVLTLSMALQFCITDRPSGSQVPLQSLSQQWKSPHGSPQKA